MTATAMAGSGVPGTPATTTPENARAACRTSKQSICGGGAPPLRTTRRHHLELFGIAAFVVLGAFSLFFLIKAAFKGTAEKRKQAERTGGTGCLSSHGCQNMDLGKAERAHYDTRHFTYCKEYEAFVRRSDHCPFFYPCGCRNGICSYAKKHCGETCFCEEKMETVTVKDSCPEYKSFFDAPLGKKLLDNRRL